MTTETARTLAGVLAQRLGVEPEQMEASLGQDPLAAALALSMMPPASREDGADPAAADPAAIVRFVASLVGACPRCLGEDAGCDECAGHGAPGSRAPDEAALVAWISRPLRRLGLCVGRPRRAPAGDNHGGGYG